MIQRVIRLGLLLGLLLSGWDSLAQVSLSRGAREQLLLPHTRIVTDSGSVPPMAEVQARLSGQEQWQGLRPIGTPEQAMDFQFRHTLRWYVVALRNDSAVDSLWVVQLAARYTYAFEAAFGRIDEQGRVSSWQAIRADTVSLFSTREFIDLPVRLAPGDEVLLLYTGGSLLPTSRIVSLARFHQRTLDEEIVPQSLLWSFVLFAAFVLFYNGLFAISLRNRLYYYYILYVFGTSIYTWFTSQVNIAWWATHASLTNYNYLMIVFVGIGFLGYIAYSRRFLETPTRQPWVDKAFLACVAILVLLMSICLVNLVAVSETLNSWVNIVLGLFVLSVLGTSLTAGIVGARKGYRPAIIYLISALFPIFSGSIIGAVLVTGGSTGDVSRYFSLLYVGFIFEYLFLSVALADRLRQSERDRDEAQDEAIAALEENQRLIEEQNRELESRVTQRTAELSATNQTLQQTLEELRATHERLLVQEKQAALAQLLSGLAHEINTPVGVSVTAATSLRDKTREVVERSTAGSLTRSDFERYSREVGELSDSLVGNLQRVSQLVQGYKSVAVTEQGYPVTEFAIEPELRRAVESLAPALTARGIELRWRGVGQQPVRQPAEALRQVITRVIDAAVRHAFAENAKGWIEITCEQTPTETHIVVADSGRTLPAELRSRFFDPFTSSEGVHLGRGANLDLHLAYQLTTRHLNGSLRIEPGENGLGNRVVVTMPTRL